MASFNRKKFEVCTDFTQNFEGIISFDIGFELSPTKISSFEKRFLHIELDGVFLSFCILEYLSDLEERKKYKNHFLLKQEVCTLSDYQKFATISKINFIINTILIFTL